MSKKSNPKGKAVMKTEKPKLTVSTERVSAAVVVSSLQKEAKPLFKKLYAVGKIDNQSDYEFAGALVKELKDLAKQADNKEKSITKPLDEAKKNTIELFKPFKEEVAGVETKIKLEMSVFYEKNKNKQLKLEQDMDSGKIKNMSTFVRKHNALTVSSGSASARTLKELVIVNDKKIPREFLMPDEAKIKAAFKAGEEVPGCEWRDKTSIAI